MDLTLKDLFQMVTLYFKDVGFEITMMLFESRTSYTYGEWFYLLNSVFRLTSKETAKLGITAGMHPMFKTPMGIFLVLFWRATDNTDICSIITFQSLELCRDWESVQLYNQNNVPLRSSVIDTSSRRILATESTAVFLLHSVTLARICLLYLPDECAVFNTLRPRQDGCQFPDDIFKCISMYENILILIEISLKFVPNAPINNIPALVQIMAWRRPGDKPLSEPMMVNLQTNICVTRPQWVNNCLCDNPAEEIRKQVIQQHSNHVCFLHVVCNLIWDSNNWMYLMQLILGFIHGAMIYIVDSRDSNMILAEYRSVK